MEQDILKKYWDILNSAEAYVRGGWHAETREAPDQLHPPGESLPIDTFMNKFTSGLSSNAASSTHEVKAEPGDKGQYTAEDTLDKIAAEVKECHKCRLSENRRNPVPGEGATNPKLMIIGEAPGAQEDGSGHPFVGRAGQYLDKWLKAINLDRTRDVFIGNIIKCRPPNNRDPLPDEIEACMPYLRRQIDLIKPRAVLTLGRISTHILTDTTDGIGKLHGRMFHFRGVPLIPTYHPSAVLRNPVFRKPVWDDLQKLQRIIEKQG